MSDLLVLVVAGIGAWMMRASAIVLVGSRPVPDGATRVLAYAKHAVLAGVVGAALASTDGAGALASNTVAAAIAALVAWRTGGVLRTLAAGVGIAGLLAVMWPV